MINPSHISDDMYADISVREQTEPTQDNKELNYINDSSVEDMNKYS